MPKTMLCALLFSCYMTFVLLLLYMGYIGCVEFSAQCN